MSRILYEKPATGYALLTIGTGLTHPLPMLVCPKNYAHGNFAAESTKGGKR